MRVEPNSITTLIQEHATTLFTSAQQLDTVLLQYFSRIHLWMPFISRHRFRQRLSGLSNTSDQTLVLLMCTMTLIGH